MHKFRFLYLFLFLSIYSCRVTKIEHEQGIVGRVLWLEGNHMPTVSEEGGNTTEESSKQVQRRIRVYELTNINSTEFSDGLFSKVDTNIIAEVESDEEGQFRIGLPPGKYSVFIVEEDGLFASIFDQHMNVNPVEITADEWMLMTINIDYKSFY